MPHPLTSLRAGLPALLLMTACTADPAQEAAPRERWTPEQAWDWYDGLPVPVGVNYVPATASNQLEMWQAETWDPDTIDAELALAEDLHINALRVFLHDLAWQQDPEGLLDRMDAFLALADAHGQRTLFVLFDGVWDPEPHAGVQEEPIPGVHNSRWVQSPGREILDDEARQDALLPYLEAVILRFREDPRVLGWDLFNEADNFNIGSYGAVELSPEDKTRRALQLLEKSFAWARAVGPTQPLIAGVYSPMRSWDENGELDPIVAFLLHEPDLSSFHTYEAPDVVADHIEELAVQDRPMLCTEYMGRPVSTLEGVLPVLHDAGVGAFSWGFVSGRTQTIWPWTTWLAPGEGEPDPWFHDLLRPDGSPYDAAEAELLRGGL